MDPSSHNTNPPGVFGQRAFEWITEAAERDAEALAAVRRFVDELGVRPTQDSWTAVFLAGFAAALALMRRREVSTA